MLNFSKINIISIYFVFLLISFFSILNFQDQRKFLIDKKVNLGLDLQGGSYLLLEINFLPVIFDFIIINSSPNGYSFKITLSPIPNDTCLSFSSK